MEAYQIEEKKRLSCLSPLDGRYGKYLNELKKYFSEEALIKYRVLVEIEWLVTLSEEPAIENLPLFSSKAKKFLRNLYNNFSLDDAYEIKVIENRTNHDVKAIEYWIADKLKSHLNCAIPMIHFGCTSEDITNLAYALLIKKAINKTILPMWVNILKVVSTKAEFYREDVMLAHTHGQPASPTTMGKEFANVYYRLKKQHIAGKINGATGNYNAHVICYPKVDWRLISECFVEKTLGLSLCNHHTTQIEPHDYLAEIFHVFSRFNTILKDFNRDIWAYVSKGYLKQCLFENEIGSSTMPHKINPINFENSEGNLGLANALFSHMAEKLPVSRMQRDLTDSVVKRSIGSAFGYSFMAYVSFITGTNKLSTNKEKMAEELSQSWEVLGEAIQSIMRKHNVPDAYEKLKKLTRGKEVTQETFKKFLDTSGLPLNVIEELLKLTPINYTGYATLF